MNIIKTYQDWEATPESERPQFIYSLINNYKGGYDYAEAAEGEAYLTGHNTLIERYQKVLYTLAGKAVPDNISAQHKLKSGFYKRFVVQRAAFLLGNGVIFNNKSNKKKFGKTFDSKLLQYGRTAIGQGVSYGYYNGSEVQFFKATEFIPLFDEETGELRAGIRFWQINNDKPIRATMFDEKGKTEYINRSGDIQELSYTPYRVKKTTSVAGGTDIEPYEAYDGFPVIPWYGSWSKQSMLIGIKEQIDCYDLIKSGFANDLDDASQIFWTMHNSGGMDDDISLAKFVERMKTVRAVAVEKDEDVQSHTVEPPYQSRQVYLTMLRKDLYEDAMALDTEQIAGGNVTATQIRAAYEALNQAADEFEACTIEFITGLMKIMGIDDDVSFMRCQNSNMLEETQMVLSAEPVIGEEMTRQKLPFLTPEEKETAAAQVAAESMGTLTNE